jgi:2-C-methyl-D-erythritol 4-phosphate cytidylyltransferase
LKTAKTFAVILSSGIGNRTGFAIPKQLVKIRGTELLLRSIAIFSNSKKSTINFDEIIITVPPQNVFEFDWKKFIAENLCSINLNSASNPIQTDNKKNYSENLESKKYRTEQTNGTTQKIASRNISKHNIKQDAKQNIIQNIEHGIKQNLEQNIKQNIVQNMERHHQQELQCKNILDKIKIIEGGDLRQKSVYNALNYIEKNFTDCNPDSIVFIHDSARPFVTNNELFMLKEAAYKFGASFLFRPVTDTIKSIENHKYEDKQNKTKDDLSRENYEPKNSEQSYFNTLDRRKLIAAKTPQVFKFNIIKKAMDYIFKNGSRLGKNEKSNSGKNKTDKYLNITDCDININSDINNNVSINANTNNNTDIYLDADNSMDINTYNNINIRLDTDNSVSIDADADNNINISLNIENFTDDISFVEHFAIPAKPILSNEFNIKITTASDIELADFFLDKFDKINLK